MLPVPNSAVKKFATPTKIPGPESRTIARGSSPTVKAMGLSYGTKSSLMTFSRVNHSSTGDSIRQNFVPGSEARRGRHLIAASRKGAVRVATSFEARRAGTFQIVSDSVDAILLLAKDVPALRASGRNLTNLDHDLTVRGYYMSPLRA